MRVFRHPALCGLALLGTLAAGCSKDLKVGAVISQSGSVSPYGEQVKKGLDLAEEEINAGGGITAARSS